ncbi:MAG: CHAP domain-containing protein [Kamptonema sp. SIO4C4]|nr:CHAP domain-containing protein [Kamptonema sp. SIO4C4]
MQEEEYQKELQYVPLTWSGEGKVIPMERAANEGASGSPSWSSFLGLFGSYSSPSWSKFLRTIYNQFYNPSKPSNDFDGDGVSEILWRNIKTGETHIWDIDPNTMTRKSSAFLDIVDTETGWQVVGKNNGDDPSQPPVPVPHSIWKYQNFAASWRNISEYTWPRNPFPNQGHNCTWYAHGRMMELGYSEYALDSMRRNAGKWDNDAARGCTVTYTPKVPCIAVWDPWVGGTEAEGHVAVVERVNSDGSIVISESNWPTGKLYQTRTIYPGQYGWPSKFITVPKA